MRPAARRAGGFVGRCPSGDRIEFPFRFSGWWLSLAERCVRDAEVAGSNPAHPTFALFRGPVIVYTGLGYGLISAVL
jgi:hypothetical protein